MRWLDSPIHCGLYSNDLSTLRFQFDEPRLNAEMIAVWSLATAKKKFSSGSVVHPRYAGLSATISRKCSNYEMEQLPF